MFCISAYEVTKRIVLLRYLGTDATVIDTGFVRCIHLDLEEESIGAGTQLVGFTSEGRGCTRLR